MAGKGSEGFLVRAQPLGAAEQISRRMVDVQVVDEALLLDAGPAWAGAINTVLIKKGVRVNELHPVSDISFPEEADGARRSAGPLSGMPAWWMHRQPPCAIIYLPEGLRAVGSGSSPSRPRLKRARQLTASELMGSA